MAGIIRPGCSLGRSQACNIAMRYWGDVKVTDEVIDTWLDRLWARNGWLSIVRKRPVPHESWFAVAAAFFLTVACDGVDDACIQIQPSYSLILNIGNQQASFTI